MNKGLGQRTPIDKLIHRLRLMADAGGVLTRDRIKTVIEAADRLEDLDERVAIMSETECKTLPPGFNVFHEEVSKHET